MSRLMDYQIRILNLLIEDKLRLIQKAQEADSTINEFSAQCIASAGLDVPSYTVNWDTKEIIPREVPE